MNELHSEQPSVLASSGIIQAAQAFMLEATQSVSGCPSGFSQLLMECQPG